MNRPIFLTLLVLSACSQEHIPSYELHTTNDPHIVWVLDPESGQVFMCSGRDGPRRESPILSEEEGEPGTISLHLLNQIENELRLPTVECSRSNPSPVMVTSRSSPSLP